MLELCVLGQNIYSTRQKCSFKTILFTVPEFHVVVECGETPTKQILTAFICYKSS